MPRRMYERCFEVAGSDYDYQGRRDWVFPLQCENFTFSMLVILLCGMPSIRNQLCFALFC